MRVSAGNGPVCLYLKLNHIPVLHDIFFSFGAEDAAFAGRGIGAGVKKFLPVNHFGADEFFLKVGVDFGGGLPGCLLIFARVCCSIIVWQ